MRRMSMLVVALVVLCAGCLAQQSETPLGDVARKKSAVKAKKVVTDEDMPSSAPVPVPAETVKMPAPPTEADLATADLATDQNSGAASTPAQKLEAMQQRVDKLKDYEGSLQKHLKQVAQKLEDEPSEFRRNMYSEALQRQAGTLESFKKQRAELESAISQMKEAQAAQAQDSTQDKKDSSDAPAAN